MALIIKALNIEPLDTPGSLPASVSYHHHRIQTLSFADFFNMLARFAEPKPTTRASAGLCINLVRCTLTAGDLYDR